MNTSSGKAKDNWWISILVKSKITDVYALIVTPRTIDVYLMPRIIDVHYSW